LPIKAALKLLLLLGLRRSEMVRLQWVNISNGWLTIPETKNGIPHRLPLTEFALSVLDTLPKINEFVFYGEGKLGHIHPDSINTTLKRLEVGDITPHDLRRTLGTSLGELGFNRLVQDKILNHIDASVGGIYDRHSYDKEKTTAMNAWSRKLKAILHGEAESNIVQLGNSIVSR
jgi:integrase